MDYHTEMNTYAPPKEAIENPDIEPGQRRFDKHSQSIAIMHYSPPTRRWVVFYPHGVVTSLLQQTIIEMYPYAIDPERHTIDCMSRWGAGRSCNCDAA